MSIQGAIFSLRSRNRLRRRSLHMALLGFLLLCFRVPAAHAQFTRFQNLTDEQGLGNLSVGALAQDRDGYILFGTQGGLYRYDGASVTSYDAGLPSAAWVQQIAVDDAGRVWVITTEGIYVRFGSRFSKVETGEAAGQTKSPHLFAVAGGSVVFDMDGTLLRAPVGDSSVGAFSPLLDAATLDSVPDLAKARFVVPETDGGLLVGCGVAVCSIEAGRVTVLGATDGLPPDAWQVALRTSDGTLWARSMDRIAWRKPGQAAFATARFPARNDGSSAAASGEHTSYTANPEMLDLVDDRHGGVLTQGGGGLIDWDGTTWHTYAHHPGGLPADRIHALMFDREGSLWVGSFGRGAFRSIGLDDWEHWTADDGLPSNIVWSMTRLPNRQFWIATDSGTVSTDGTPPGVPAETNYAVNATRAGRLWLSPVGMPLTRRDPAQGQVEQLAFPGKVVSADVDHDNRLWLGTSKGLFMVADADAPATDLRADLVLAHATTLVTTDPAGLVWVLSPDGIFRRDGAGQFDLVIPSALLQSEPDALAFSPDGDLWVGTGSEGVLRFRMTGGQAEPLPSLASPMIGSNNVLFAHCDHRGWMWLGTDHGIDMFDGQGWRHFDSSGGPITNDMDQSAVYEDFDGSMWFGTSHGLSHLIDPARKSPDATLHPLVTGVSLGERTLPVSQATHADWSPEPLVIRFVDLDYSHGRGIAFRYRLSGLETGWSNTIEHEVRYSDLPAGELRFELIAVDALHGSISAETGFTIHVRAPWWRRWWFYGLCAFAAMALLVGSWQARMRLLLHNQRRLEQVVSARTAEIDQARCELQHQAGELERQAVDMQRLAMSDALTGLANRRAIMGALEAAIAAALGSETPLAVLLCDIDHFKRINDNFGHLAGDEVLTAFGRRLGAAVEPPETAGRYGGEEFLVLLPGDPNALAGRVSSIRSAITDASYAFGDADRTVTSSGGLAFLRAGDTAVSLLERADEALYKAKENGRNRIEEERSEASDRRRELQVAVEVVMQGATASSHDSEAVSWNGNVDLALPHTHYALQCSGGFDEHESECSSLQQRDLEHELRSALASGEFVLHYQPVVDIDKDVVTSFEALLRWQSPSRGNVPPVEFIPFAEKVGLIAEIGDWVLRVACREAASWQDDLKVSVNLSALQLRLPDLVDRVAKALAGAGLPPERLELEVTETAMIDDVAAAASMLQRLRAMGVTIALDDFGTGYSSLSFLRALPFNRIKIDRSFVQDLGVKPEATAIVRAIVGLCRGLGIAATAEGVETDQQVKLLRAAGCSELQGFQIGHPRPIAEMQEWMAAFAASHSNEPAS